MRMTHWSGLRDSLTIKSHWELIMLVGGALVPPAETVPNESIEEELEDDIDDAVEEEDGGDLNAKDVVRDPVEIELVADVVSEFVSSHTECKDPGITVEVILGWLRMKGG